MRTYTSTLPDELLEQLDEASKRFKMPKNKLIERALEIYLDQINRAEYVKSFRKAGQDEEIISMAEEGMAEYLNQLDDNVTG